MGCWNGTCAITNLPIHAGEEVYVLLLQESASYEKYEGDHCHHNTYYQPLPLYFEGEYNDYGAVENCHGDFLDDIVESVKDVLFEMPLGKNECHDIEISKEKFDVDFLFEADHEARLFIHPWAYEKQRGTEKLRLTHITVRKKTLDDLLKNFKIESWRIEEPLSFDKMIVDNYPKFKETIGKGITPWILQDLEPMNHIMRGYRICQAVLDPCKLIEKYLEDEEKLKALFRQFTVNFWLETLMQQSRNQWIKPSGAGSQDSETNAQEMISSLIMSGVQDLKQYYIDNDW